MAWLAGGYTKRKALKLTGGASGALTDHQLKITVSYAAAMQGDFDDLRFTQADGTTLVDAWAEVIVADTSAVVWVEFPTTPANTVEQTYYMYYGNAAAASDWDGDATFLFFDDYTNLTNWTQTVGTWTTQVFDGFNTVRCDNDGSGTHSILKSNYAQTENQIVECKLQPVAYGTYRENHIYTGIEDSNNRFLIRPIYRSDHWEIEWIRYLSGAYSYGDLVNPWATGLSLDNWHTFKIVQVGDTAYFYIDEEALSSVTQADVWGTYTNPTVGIGNANSDTYFTDFRVRKYAANPPTYEFGAEESEPTGEAAPTSIFYGPFVGPLGGPV